MASSLSFFALHDDLISVLEYLFAETDARVFEAYSELAGGRVHGRGPVLRAASGKARTGWTLKENRRAPWVYAFTAPEQSRR